MPLKKNLLKLRFSYHKLPIHAQRFLNVPRNERRCFQVCAVVFDSHCARPFSLKCRTLHKASRANIKICPPPLRLSTAGREVVLSLQEARYRAGAGWQGAGEAQQEDGRGWPHVRSGAGSTVGRTLTFLTPAADSISILPSDERGAPIAAQDADGSDQTKCRLMWCRLTLRMPLPPQATGRMVREIRAYLAHELPDDRSLEFSGWTYPPRYRH